MNTSLIYVVDDEKTLRIPLVEDLKDMGYQVKDFENPLDAVKAFKKELPSVVISDLKMPQMNGIQFLEEILKINPDTKVIILTAYGTIDTAVEAMKKGAYDYLTKPFMIDELLLRIKRTEEIINIEERNLEFQQHFSQQYHLGSFLGSSPKSRQVLELVKIVAKSDSTVLITGETGTGKELLANIIHYSSPRRYKPLVKVSCAILAKDVIESELFGHEKGAFTGAVNFKKGRFEAAHQGTIFLDDIDDIPLDVQVKLLRVLQEREIERVGSIKHIKVDVRVIASSKYDLEKMVKEGKFREDLYYRLNVFPIQIPPLRERAEDIEELVYYFLKLLQGRDEPLIDKEIIEIMKGYHFPGNVRELKNIIERLVLLSGGKRITKEFLPPELRKSWSIPKTLPSYGEKTLNDMLAEAEIELLKDALERAENQAEAAKLLGIPPSTLRSKLQKYGL